MIEEIVIGEMTDMIGMMIIIIIMMNVDEMIEEQMIGEIEKEESEMKGTMIDPEEMIVMTEEMAEQMTGEIDMHLMTPKNLISHAQNIHILIQILGLMKGIMDVFLQHTEIPEIDLIVVGKQLILGG